MKNNYKIKIKDIYINHNNKKINSRHEHYT